MRGNPWDGDGVRENRGGGNHVRSVETRHGTSLHLREHRYHHSRRAGTPPQKNVNKKKPDIAAGLLYMETFE